MLTHSINGDFRKVIDNGKAQQYLDGVKVSPLMSEWGSLWLIKNLEGETISLYSFAEKSEMRYGANSKQETKVARLDAIAVFETYADSTLDDIKYEAMMKDQFSHLAFDEIENNMVRKEMLKDWYLLVKTIMVLEGRNFIKVMQSIINDKAKTCCGIVAKKIAVNKYTDELVTIRYKNKASYDRWKQENKYFEDTWIVHTCTCKQVRANRITFLRDVMSRYKADGLIKIMLQDSVLTSVGVWNTDTFPLEHDTQGWTLDDYQKKANDGFGGSLYEETYY